jgi:CubicO group peptidase (beta-lactamase class C family)
MPTLKRLFLPVIFILCILPSAFAQVLTQPQVDSLVQATLKAFDVPGIAVAVVKDGKVVFAKGYGVASLNTRKPVDENTRFGIASNSKAFTVAALAILADEGKLKLDDKVTDYIPEFKMYDPYVSQEFTIRDLLTHRSGLGLGAGDLMIFPDSGDFGVKDIIHNVRYLKPASSFRSKFDYDNLMYVIAGEIIARVSGMSWGDFIETRIMRPLQMNNSAASYPRLKSKENVMDPHAPVDGKVRVISRYVNETTNAAGGINSSVADMSKWLIMQLNDGKYGEGLNKQLFSSAMHREMWSPQTVVRSNPGVYNTHFAAYGLGFFLRDVKGYFEVWHTGGLDGNVTEVTMLPELNLGILVFTNQESGAAMYTITNEILDGYLGLPRRDLLKQNLASVDDFHSESEKIVDSVWKQVSTQQAKKVVIDMAVFGGIYHDNWLGDVEISKTNGVVRFKAKKSPKLSGEVFPLNANTFVVKWDIHSMHADAYLIFNLDEYGKPVGLKMKPISPETDFSYDFQDLDFVKVN